MSFKLRLLIIFTKQYLWQYAVSAAVSSIRLVVHQYYYFKGSSHLRKKLKCYKFQS